MRKLIPALFCTMLYANLTMAQDSNPPQVKVANGTIEGYTDSGIFVFKGIPYAAPPIGKFRWVEPQPVKSWKGILKTTTFGPRCVQSPIFSDMVFRSFNMSEDCLYLNVWTSSTTTTSKLPVLVYFYGGGFVGGDGSEPRYDGESMSRKGIVAVTVNYRLGVFGFFAHPELSKESPHHASGNYGLMDQAAAIKWVHDNIKAFGGDPDKITIAGESAGSFSVCAQMASPFSRDLIAGAIGESGSLLTRKGVPTLKQAEQIGLDFQKIAGAASLKELREMTANNLLQAAARPHVRFTVTTDGYFFPEPPLHTFQKGKQSNVPMLAGWNSEEENYRSIVESDPITRNNFSAAVKKRFNTNAPEILKLYAGANTEELKQAATDLASDEFTGFSTWKWIDIQVTTGTKPVYRYLYGRPRPKMLVNPDNEIPAEGASHSAEIEYALGNLPGNKAFEWQPEDYKVSEIMQTYFVNFIKTGNPNGNDQPKWSPVKKGVPASVMYIDVETKPTTEKNRERYLFLDKISAK